MDTHRATIPLGTIMRQLSKGFSAGQINLYCRYVIWLSRYMYMQSAGLSLPGLLPIYHRQRRYRPPLTPLLYLECHETYC